MRVDEYPLQDRFLIVPNREEYFGEVRTGENCLDVIETFTFKNLAEIYLIRLGAIGLQFLENGPLASITVLRPTGSGTIPENVTKNRDLITDLQGRRVVFANFIAAALFGRIAALRHASLSGAQYVGLDEILGFAPSGTQILLENSRYSKAIFRKLELANEQPNRIRIVSPDHLAEALTFIRDIARREEEFERANLQACMVMNYQGAILHNAQHSAASLALNFAVAEALINEIFIAYGIVGERPPKLFATRPHTCTPITDAQFLRYRVKEKINRLRNGELIDDCLCRRLHEARDLRNDLMHGAVSVTTTQTGALQTVVRDLWTYLLDDKFELNAAWSMRI